MKFFVLFVLAFLCSVICNAQTFSGFPTSTNWQQLNTDTARIIFTKPVSAQAQRIASLIHIMVKQNANPLGDKLKKINIVLHQNTTLANGYVGLAPFRSEYYLLPPSDIFALGTNPWSESLAMHEYRHVQQFNNFNKGITKVAGIVFGEGGRALFNGLSIPDWFFEGDAVHAETAQTNQGRGRAPYFFNGFNALWQHQRSYSWMKLRNGSLRDYVPNHYQLGYLLANYGYKKYGDDFWGKVTNDASRFKGLFYPFQKAVQRHAGVDFKTFRNEALDFYKHEISTRRDKQVKREIVADHFFPQLIGSDTLLYVKSTYNKIPAFYLKNKEGEHRLGQRRITTEDWFTYRNGIVAYTAYDVHPRWALTDYSNIILLDIGSGKDKKITAKGKYFTPDISPDGNNIIAVSFTDSATAELHLLKKDGSVISRLHPKVNGELFVNPRFINNQSLVVAVRHNDGEMSIQKINLVGADASFSKSETLVGPTLATLGYPMVVNNSLYFVSSVSGNDDIYSLELSASQPARPLAQLTAGGTGNYYPSVFQNKLVWSNFTSNGLQVVQKSLDSIQGYVVPLAAFNKRAIPYVVASDSSTIDVPAIAGNLSLPVQPYKKSTGLFNFHSRRPAYTDPEISFSLYSDNILNTLSQEIFYRYNQNEASHAVGFNSYYGGLYPVLNAGITYTANRNLKTKAGTYTFGQLEATGGFHIPLNFTGGKTFKYLNFGSNYVYSQLQPTGLAKNIFNAQTSSYLHHFINWSQQLPKARQQIFPKFGYALSGGQRRLLGNNGFQFVGGTRFYLPSIKNHSLVLAANLQETDTSNITFSNRFANSRGYNDYFFSRMWRVTGNYHMPLVYPDWGFASIVYFMRVRSNFFYDYTRVYGRSKLVSREQRSVGAELYFDTKWWNALPVSFGLRVSHLLDDDFSGRRPKGSNFFEFILPVDLIPR